MKFRPECDSIIFDLDGTLWNATPAVALGWASVTKELNLNISINENSIKSICGLPFDKCAEVIFGDFVDKIHDLKSRLEEAEHREVSRLGGQLYPGVSEGIKKLSEEYNLFFVSNCQEWYMQSFFKHSGLQSFFQDAICFGQTGQSKKENIQEIVKRNNLAKSIYVGDTHWDQEAAFFAGIKFIFADFGFGSLKVASPFVQSFDELVALMMSPARKPNVSIRKLKKDEFEIAQTFYQSVGYTPTVHSEDKFFAAFDDNKIVGLVRLAYEKQTWVLRGMQIVPSYQFFGIGSKLISLLEAELGSQQCYCLPHGWLENFYSQIGFKVIEPSADVPLFLVERLNEIKKRYPQLILMKRNQK